MSDDEFIGARARDPLVPAPAAHCSIRESPWQLPLPGVIILVHGVNSMGEWYEEAEAGLCAGLNERLAREEGKIRFANVAGGRLAKNAYGDEIDEDGELIDADPRSFITACGYSPVIRFRWGYRCCTVPYEDGSTSSAEPRTEATEFASEVLLNRDDAWGGGPFQNGTSCLSDLWNPGLNDRLFLWINAQRLNPTNRPLYKCPLRAYMVHAAQRLADLVKDIRETRDDCPITIVCHSQGNMVGIASALMAKDPLHVADTYVLANPPYSVESLLLYEYANPSAGARTAAERIATLRRFADRVRARGARTRAAQTLARINDEIANEQQGRTYFKLCEQANYEQGEDRDNRGSVFLYVNPHDQVIGASAIQGIGWKGLTEDQLGEINRNGKVLYQRVWAQGAEVGLDAGREPRSYHYWKDHWRAKDGQLAQEDYWYPHSAHVKYRLERGRHDESSLGKIWAWISTPFVSGVLALIDWVGSPVTVNAFPPSGHAVPIDAPPVRTPLRPASARAGSREGNSVHGAFDEGEDDLQRLRTSERDSWARRELRMEDKAMERLHLAQEAKGGGAGWAQKQNKSWFNAQPDNATDHSTILKSETHCARVLAYDVAVGAARIPEEKWAAWRKLAHWRFVDPAIDPYYQAGAFQNGADEGDARTAVQRKYSPDTMPDEIADGRIRDEQRMAFHDTPRSAETA